MRKFAIRPAISRGPKQLPPGTFQISVRQWLERHKSPAESEAGDKVNEGSTAQAVACPPCTER
jgi:hypothetical protein